MIAPNRPRQAGGLAGTVVLLAVAAGCGAPSGASPAASPAPTSAASTSATTSALTSSRPVRLTIDSIGVDTGLIDLGLQADGTMEVPPDGATAGWYTASPTPGEIGPAVLAAHVDWKGQEGVFFDLRRLAVGDAVNVERADGRTARFAVLRVDQYPKDEFPTAAVYGDVASPQLRLITCGGDFDRAARSYRDNVVVYAELTG